MNRREMIDQLRKTKDSLQSSVARVDSILKSLQKDEDDEKQLPLEFDERFPVTRPIMNKERKYAKD
jgi:hypothetical protein